MGIGHYGWITAPDAALLERALVRTSTAFKSPVIVEVGVQTGDTARGIKRYMDILDAPFEYWGIDNQRDMGLEPPFAGANIVIGDSVGDIHRLPEQMHLVFIDGCHCLNHVMLDFLHYSQRVVGGGRVIFHDAAEITQGIAADRNRCKLPGLRDGVRVLRALRYLGLYPGKHPHWLLEDENIKMGEPVASGGAMCFVKFK